MQEIFISHHSPIRTKPVLFGFILLLVLFFFGVIISSTNVLDTVLILSLPVVLVVLGINSFYTKVIVSDTFLKIIPPLGSHIQITRADIISIRVERYYGWEGFLMDGGNPFCLQVFDAYGVTQKYPLYIWVREDLEKIVTYMQSIAKKPVS